MKNTDCVMLVENKCLGTTSGDCTGCHFFKSKDEYEIIRERYSSNQIRFRVEKKKG